MTQDTEQRIIELESRLEFQEDTIARLNDALVVQQQRYFVLEKRFNLLVEQLKEHDVELPDPADEGPPPHY